ncbi:HdeD family acid-resistance protein [Secundilactobacillus silagei]|uniref:Membrane protein n=1 Tax=Secundilactobacillus silagei JCM 19001 TaxID=1302250 RepID=A0A1Z5IGM2_9LACO|nr:DUF308 domain-containing protein [Secundilactobacillus silagei]TDG69231.1 hypothetical protein C5L25_000162 [Secundilactobacillus silagei JCM 19001]GAX00954.1 membrane protein [Secundilactobacillus silagei JCM 19001]
MFSMRPKWGFDWHELITGVLSLIAAYVVVGIPRVSLTAMAVIFGLLAILSGLTTLSGVSKLREFVGNWANAALVFAVIDLLIGVFFIVKPSSGIVVLGYLVAFWFLIDAVERLMVVGHLRDFGSGYFIASLILDILSLLIGIMLLINPVIAIMSMTWLIGFYLIVFGINAIMLAFARR